MMSRIMASIALATLTSLAPTLAQVPVPIGSEFQVNTTTASNQYYVAAAIDAEGRFVVVWDSFDGSNSGLFGQRFDQSGNRLGAEFMVNTHTTSNQHKADVAADPSGNIVVVWEGLYQEEIRSGQSGVFAQMFDAFGNRRGQEFRVNTYMTSQQRDPAVDVAENGNFVVTWTSLTQDGDNYGVFAQRYDRTGSPLGAEFQVNTHTPNGQRTPDVASDGTGSFVVVWDSLFQVDPRAAGLDVYGQIYDPSGSPRGEEFRVNTYATSQQRWPTVGRGRHGEFVVTWTSTQELGSYGVFAQRFDRSGVRLGGEFQVNEYTTRHQLLSDVAVDEDGNFVIVWEGYPQIGRSFEILGRRYDAAGQEMGGEFLVNTYTSGAQQYPAVAAGDRGEFVVVWQGPDGNGVGIFGQRYAGPGLYLGANGGCPGNVDLTILNAPPNSEIAIVAAANTNGFTKGGLICPGTELELGEPFALPPSFIIVDAQGQGSSNVELQEDRCFLQALAFADCSTSRAVRVPPAN